MDSFLVNKKKITDKNLKEYFKDVIINHYEEHFLEKASEQEKNDPDQYPEFKTLYKELKAEQKQSLDGQQRQQPIADGSWQVELSEHAKMYSMKGYNLNEQYCYICRNLKAHYEANKRFELIKDSLVFTWRFRNLSSRQNSL